MKKLFTITFLKFLWNFRKKSRFFHGWSSNSGHRRWKDNAFAHKSAIQWPFTSLEGTIRVLSYSIWTRVYFLSWLPVVTGESSFSLTASYNLTWETCDIITTYHVSPLNGSDGWTTNLDIIWDGIRICW